jgi:hypothetical protein
MSSAAHRLIRTYLKFFQMFLDGDIVVQELDYMMFLRDRIHEEGGELGDLDSVWRAHARKMLLYKSLFHYPMSDAWWWKKEAWEKLASKQRRAANGKRKRSARTASSM